MWLLAYALQRFTMAKLSYRWRCALYVILLPLTLLLTFDFRRFLLWLCLVALVVALCLLYMRLFISDRVSIKILEDVEVDATRNFVDSNFIEATDPYVHATAHFGGCDYDLKCANLGLARRAAAAVSTVDAHAIAMLVSKDHNSGGDKLKLETD